ncbi:MAG TPA: hypothetical protein VLF40_04900 [Candidatus Saccharimonadales bacterium]|nr:hypothetical protein [Candidatus Saccharimonadales bacterium]
MPYVTSLEFDAGPAELLASNDWELAAHLLQLDIAAGVHGVRGQIEHAPYERIVNTGDAGLFSHAPAERAWDGTRAANRSVFTGEPVQVPGFLEPRPVGQLGRAAVFSDVTPADEPLDQPAGNTGLTFKHPGIGLESAAMAHRTWLHTQTMCTEDNKIFIDPPQSEAELIAGAEQLWPNVVLMPRDRERRAAARVASEKANLREEQRWFPEKFPAGYARVSADAFDDCFGEEVFYPDKGNRAPQSDTPGGKHPDFTEPESRTDDQSKLSHLLTLLRSVRKDEPGMLVPGDLGREAA